MTQYDPSLYLRQNPADRWIFRWVFEFSSGSRKIGGWFPASRVEDMASSVNKTGLLYAIVEGKHWLTREQKEFARVDGPDFINFEHLAALIVMPDQRQINHVYGMRIQSRYNVVSCLENGEVHVEKQRPIELYPEWTRY